MQSRGTPSVRLSLEQLECRELMSAGWALETFDNATPRTLPTGWQQWSSTANTPVQVIDGAGFGSNNGLATVGRSNTTARAWQTGTSEKDVQLQADVFLNSLAPIQLFARGQNLDTTRPTYYAVTVTRGMEVSLQRVVNGVSTTLGKVTSDDWLSNQWVRVNLQAQGSKLTVQIFRTDTAQYLNSTGEWQSAPASVISLTDTAITTAGRVGINRNPGVNGQVAIDNFAVNKTLTTTTLTALNQQDFGSNLTRGLPANWSSYTNTQGQTLQVSASNKALTGSSAIGVTGDSGLVARAWSNTQFPADVQVSAALYLDSLVPALVFARGQDVDTDSPEYYGLSITRGATVQLVRVIDGRTTVLGTVTTDAWLGKQWVQTTLSVSGTTLRAQVYRSDTGQYLMSDGQWSALPVWAIEKTDGTIRGPGKAGIGRSSGYTGSVSFDNFLVTAAAGTTTTPTTPPTDPTPAGSRTFDFDTSRAGALPSGWSSYSKTNQGKFAVTSSPALSAPNALSSVGGSDVDTRAWFAGQTYSDSQIVGSFLVDGLAPSMLFTRGTNLSSAQASYYGVSVSRGLSIDLFMMNNGQRTRLATLSSATYVSNVWLTVGLRTVANTLEVVVFRQDTQQYLAANRTWQSAATAAISTTNGALRSGYSGVGRPAAYSGRVLVDNVSLVDLANSTPPTPPDDSPNTPGPETPGPGTNNGTTGVQHYGHIRIAQLAYYGTPIGDFETNLLKKSVDLVVANPVYLDQMEAVAPGTSKLIYTNYSNVYLDLLTDWLAYADRNGIDRESAFYHVNQAMSFTGNSGSSRPVSWFWSVQRGTAAGTWTDFTRSARKNAENFALGAMGESVVIGYPEKFREINVALQRAAGAGWKSVIEYASAVDANGKPTAWKTLNVTGDATNGFRSNGTITFDPPPADWKAASIGGSDRFYYVRIRTIGSGTAPTVSTVLGRDYVRANGTTSGVVPAFDKAADRNNDGYLDDAEYAKRRPGFDARFVYESRVFYPAYGQMRFATNVSNAAFQKWSADYSYRYLAGYPNADGLFADNSFGRLQIDQSRLQESLTNYAEDYGKLLAGVNTKIAPRWVLANTAGAGKSADPIVRNGVAFLEEFALRPLVTNTTQFEDIAALVKSRLALSGGKGTAILDTYPQGGSPTDSRTQIAALSYYYLLAEPKQTYLMFNGGYEPATSWTRHWSEAVTYNVGLPRGTWSILATGKDPGRTSLTYKIYQREYDNALVLYKPLSYHQRLGTGTLSDSTATTHILNGNYRTLNANGTLGAVINRITLRNGEGAILVKA